MRRSLGRALLGYKERHHRVPRCLGGSDDPSNLVVLTPEEHYVAHQLLVHIHPEHMGILWSALYMTGKGKTRGNKCYGWLRRRFALKWKGKRRSLETRRKMSVARRAALARGVQRKPHTPEARRNISAAHTGVKRSAAHCAAMSAGKLGKKLKPHSEAWKANQSASIRAAFQNGANHGDHTAPEYRARQAAAMKEIWERRRAGELPPRKPRKSIALQQLGG